MELIIPDSVTQNTEAEVSKPPTSLLQESKLCACGRMFTPYRSYQRYCCDAHRIKYNKNRPKKSYYTKRAHVERTCKECKKTFTTNDSKRNYCSKECYEQHEVKRRKNAEQRVCFVCGQTFETTHWLKRYCSEACRIKAHKA